VQGIRSNQVYGQVYDVSLGSQHHVFFPYHAGKNFQIDNVEELLSFSMDVKTDFVYLLFEAKTKIL
jgi:hypothetical protein